MTKSDLAMTPEQIAETESVSEALGNLVEFQTGDYAIAVVRAVMEATPPAQEDEPVGFRWKKKGANKDWKLCPMEHYDDEYVRDHCDTEFLYTHPANDELRKAAEEVLEQIRLYSECKFGWHGIREAAENLRAALKK